jgi:hypothetical protein
MVEDYDVPIITMDQIYSKVKPGDIGLTASPKSTMGKLIQFGQRIDEGDESKYGHAFIFAKNPGTAFKIDGTIYESVLTLSKNHVSKYYGRPMCIIRHKHMSEDGFYLGREEILDNLGQIYPAHRIALHGVDMINSWICRKIFRSELKCKISRLAPLDWPVCSEYAAQFIKTANLETGWGDFWRGVNPDLIDNTRTERTDLYFTILEGIMEQ